MSAESPPGTPSVPDFIPRDMSDEFTEEARSMTRAVYLAYNDRRSAQTPVVAGIDTFRAVLIGFTAAVAIIMSVFGLFYVAETAPEMVLTLAGVGAGLFIGWVAYLVRRARPR